ncbi:MAG: helix-hairpin-helix domain-containing protein [Agathobacter sp.]|uniref:helix-hairpin-helix domain-containing protein n=1 Tax=Agathobacter sp. TaxID=2021311 RepID=UPI002582F8FD|nr:helix-hairpin-helix domain-containing protein [Agathobacter sp.]MCR5678442.1 helix-hairpin-helix domain-containing protein [Agathobacter sp.]
MKLNSTVTFVAAFSLLLIGCGREQKMVLDHVDTEKSTMVFEETSTKIFVYICGAVQKPGVYEMPENARVCDLIRCAGGFCENAKEDYYNQAELLFDGEKVYIPAEDEFIQNESEVSTDSGKVNINLADSTELMTIPGIGATKAAAIVAYREANGKFQHIEDIVNVSGIGDSTYQNMKDYITIS